MSARRILPHSVAWLGVFAAWLVATRRYHPTLPIAIGATALLIGASAAAVYANDLVLMPRLARRRRAGAYAASLLATVAALDLLAVGSIQLVYAWLWHPDPLRFGVWYNLASDGFIILAHVAVAAGLAALLKRHRLRERE